MPDADSYDIITYSAALARFLSSHLGAFTENTPQDVLDGARRATNTAQNLLGKDDPRSALFALDYLDGTASDNADMTRLMWSFRDLNGLILGLIAEIDSFDDFGVLLDRLRSTISSKRDNREV